MSFSSKVLNHSASFTHKVKSFHVQLQEVPYYLYFASSISILTLEELFSLWSYFCQDICLSKLNFLISNLVCLGSACLIPCMAAWTRGSLMLFLVVDEYSSIFDQSVIMFHFRSGLLHPLINTWIPPPLSLHTHTCISVNLGKSCGLKFQKILDYLNQLILWKLQGIHPLGDQCSDQNP